MNVHQPKARKIRRPSGAQARQLAALTRELSRCCVDKEERICRSFGLHAADGRVLSAIYGEKLNTASELAERLRIGNSRLTPLVDRLVRQGLVSRAESGNDRRVRRIELTEAGRTVAVQLLNLETQLHQELLSQFPDSERAALVETLQRLKLAMDEIRRSIEF